MTTPTTTGLPLEGIRVVEFTHMVMGPTCGMVLADLGAEVIKVEPLAGDATRRLLGSGSGFFAMFNRNKRSITLDLKTPEGLALAREPRRSSRRALRLTARTLGSVEGAAVRARRSAAAAVP